MEHNEAAAAGDAHKDSKEIQMLKAGRKKGKEVGILPVEEQAGKVKYDEEPEKVIIKRNAVHDAGSMTKQPFQQMIGMTKHAKKTMVQQLVVYLAPRQGFGI